MPEHANVIHGNMGDCEKILGLKKGSGVKTHHEEVCMMDSWFGTKSWCLNQLQNTEFSIHLAT